MKKIYLPIFALLFAFGPLFGQDEAADQPQSYPVMDIFYGTRGVNLATVRQVGKKVFAYRISHRFGDVLNEPVYNWFGLDGPANISFMFDYGISDKLMIGLARDQFNKVYNGYAKYTLFNQESGGKPFTLALYGRANMISLKNITDDTGFGRYDNFAHRLSYVTQVLLARKFGNRFSLQLAPTWVHHNLVESSEDKNDMFGASVVAQYKLTKRLGVTAEYTYVFNQYAENPDNFYNSAGIGLDIVTGGHVFQIVLINSAPINEAFAIPYTASDWLNGDFRLGFNISREFFR